MASPVHVTADSFKATVLDSSQPVLVDFWATWCGPCKRIAPVLDEIAGEYDGKAVIAKVNVDDERELAGTYQIMGIPALFFFKGGQKVDELIGAHPKDAITKKLDALL